MLIHPLNKKNKNYFILCFIIFKGEKKIFIFFKYVGFVKDLK